MTTQVGEDAAEILRMAARKLGQLHHPQSQILATVMGLAAASHGGCCDLDCDTHVALTRLAVVTLSGPTPEPPTSPHLDGAMGTIWLHGRWRELTRHMDTDEREAAAASVERWSANLGDGETMGESSLVELRWWADPYEEIAAAVDLLTTTMDRHAPDGPPSDVAQARLRLATAMLRRPTAMS